jgi:hypothetical protein
MISVQTWFEWLLNREESYEGCFGSIAFSLKPALSMYGGL